jgi:hypothetical protein
LCENPDERADEITTGIAISLKTPLKSEELKHSKCCPRKDVLNELINCCNQIRHSIDLDPHFYGPNPYAQGEAGMRKKTAEKVFEIIKKEFPLNKNWLTKIEREIKEASKPSFVALCQNNSQLFSQKPYDEAEVGNFVS